MSLGHLYPFNFTAVRPQLIVLNLFTRVEPCQKYSFLQILEGVLVYSVILI
jgi:hypothetical protein